MLEGERAPDHSAERQMVIPWSLQEEIHGGVSGAHLGVDKTLEKLKERFYWPDFCNQGGLEIFSLIAMELLWD